MYIRRKVFSLMTDEMGEDRYFSTTDYAYFSEKEENKQKKISLDKIESTKGFDLYPETKSIYKSIEVANKLDKQGKSDKEIIKGASKRGALSGGVYNGAVVGAALTPATLKLLIEGEKRLAAGVAIGGTATGAALGALRGYKGAKKNIEARLERRNKYKQ